MLSISQTKLLAALQVKKYRQKYRKFTVEGEKMVEELLKQTRFNVDALYALEPWAAAHVTSLRAFADRFHLISEPELRKISALQTPNQVLAVVDMPEDTPVGPLQGFYFYLDGIQDPGNLGTILRVADWFGFSGVFCSPDTVDVFNSKVIQSSMGAFLRVNCREMALEELLQEQSGLAVLGADMEGANLFKTGLPEHALVIIGSEGGGIRPPALARVTQRVSIPRGPGGGAESLNAGVAAGIIAAVLVHH